MVPKRRFDIHLLKAMSVHAEIEPTSHQRGLSYGGILTDHELEPITTAVQSYISNAEDLA
jgi:hypothetical protein